MMSTSVTNVHSYENCQFFPWDDRHRMQAAKSVEIYQSAVTIKLDADDDATCASLRGPVRRFVLSLKG